MAKTKKPKETISLEQTLWKAADKLRKNMDAAEYKHVVLGLIFLKFISGKFEKLHALLSEGNGEYEGADPEDRDEYLAENIFYVPEIARWSYLQSQAKLPSIGTDVDLAMDAIEAENPSLKGVLPREYGKEKLDKASLGQLIDLIGKIELDTDANQSNDVLGNVYEYFLGQFALAEGKKGGQFYTPRSVVELLVEMLQPFSGRVLDPCCGSGGMFVQSEKFVQAHADHYKSAGDELSALFNAEVSIYGQESNQTTWRLCKMNLALRGIDSSNIKWNNEGSFLQDAHPDLKADYVIANPPFNDSDWSGELLQEDGRWQYSRVTPPPPGNANYAWIQHFLYHLSPNGKAGFVLSKGALSTGGKEEAEIRKALIEAGLVDCIVNLPAKLFLNTQIPACLWFLSREKESNPNHPHRNQILFIDAREKGKLISRATRILTNGTENPDENDIRDIASVYHAWQKGDGYVDVPGFCKVADLEEVRAKDYVLTPGRYLDMPEDDEEVDLEALLHTLTVELEQQMLESEKLNERIRQNLARLEVSKDA